MALTTSISATLSATQTGANDYGGPNFTPFVNTLLSLTDGVGASQANMIFADERTVASASNDDIDLYGSLVDAFGATMNMVKIVAVMVVNAPRSGAANTTSLTIGAGTNPFVGFLGGTTPTIKSIGPGGVVLLASPDATGLGTVTAATADILRIANSSGASATYQIAIIARNA